MILSKLLVQAIEERIIQTWSFEELQSAAAVLNASLTLSQLKRNYQAVGGLPKAMTMVPLVEEGLEQELTEKLKVCQTGGKKHMKACRKFSLCNQIAYIVPRCLV